MSALAVPLGTVKVTASSADFDALYRAEFAKLVGALHLYCGDVELAYDCVQEAMARACRDWAKVGELPAPSAWVYRVAINLATSWFRRAAVARRAARRVVRSGAAVHLDPDTGMQVALRRAVIALSRREREALVLRYVADLAIDEVAEIMHCAPGTVKALTHRGITKLRASGVAHTEDEDQ